MLSLLRISNYAIIDDLEIELRPGFSVMTGETGAGKSILVDALGLALGDRADSNAVRRGAKRAAISLVFELEPNHPAAGWLAERGLDSDDSCTLRRTITAEGRSRAFVNNQPVTLQDLKSLGGLLVDIHGQHEHQSLLTTQAQRKLLDASCKLDALADRVAQAFGDWQEAERQRQARADRDADREAELELKRFQLDELETLALREGELEELRAERDRLSHVDALHQAAGQAAELLYESDSGSAHSMTARARRALEPVLAHDASLQSLVERITAAEVEIREAANDLTRRIDELEADPARLDEIEARLDRVQQLARRHRVNESELPGLPERLGAEIAALSAGAESAEALEKRCIEMRRVYTEQAEALSAARAERAKPLGQAVTAGLRELGLPHAEFCVALSRKAEARFDSTGLDQVEFRVSMNPGTAAGPIQRIASGGELSRVGLALSVVGIDASSIPTLVFDEVDAGIGGAVAEVVGRRLREIGVKHQVLSVTHLPQLASQGIQHYRIVKLTDGNTSRTQVRELDVEQRIEELSRMLGGLEITAATRAHAEEMIRQAAGTQ